MFRATEVHVLPDGAGSAAGVVVRGGAEQLAVNLNQPRVARALLDAALASGWDGTTDHEIDGWPLLGERLRYVPPRA